MIELTTCENPFAVRNKSFRCPLTTPYYRHQKLAKTDQKSVVADSVAACILSAQAACGAHTFAAHKGETVQSSMDVSAHTCRNGQSDRLTLQPLVRFLMSQLPPCSRPGMVRAASMAALSNWGVPFSRPPRRAPIGWGRLAASHHTSGVIVTGGVGSVGCCCDHVMQWDCQILRSPAHNIRLDGCLP